MQATVPGDVDEADQVPAIVGADVDEATLQHRPEVARCVPIPRRREESVQVLSAEGRINAAANLAVAHAKISPRGKKILRYVPRAYRSVMPATKSTVSVKGSSSLLVRSTGCSR